MDPNLVYSRYRDDAFAALLTASEYATFVAMPFGERFSYRSAEIYGSVIQAAIGPANAALEKEPSVFASRRFSTPRRVDDQPQTARVIDDEILKAILFAHVVVADLTFANDGVLLEVGAALALKPTAQIVLITQGSPASLHFDIRNNAIIEYSLAAGVGRLAEAMVEAVRGFESDRRDQLSHLSRELSRDAIWLMNWYGRLRNGWFKDEHGTRVVASLHEKVGVPAFLRESETAASSDASKLAEASTRFQLAIRELLGRRLIWTDYQPRTPEPGVDSYSYRGTDLGWMFITHLWDDLHRPDDEAASPLPQFHTGTGRSSSGDGSDNLLN